jgi:hypothetical protein
MSWGLRRKTMKAIRHISLVLIAVAFLSVSHASAITVVANFIGGAAPSNAKGGGNLPEIFDAAARKWAAAYGDPGTITINFGWAPLGDAGTHTLIVQGGLPNRETAGLILFDNSGAVKFYLDPTPDSNEEYRRRTEEFQDLGGGFVNVARLFSSPVGDAAGCTDLLSAALHEIGHALGMSAANTAFRLEAAQGNLRIAENLPDAGTVIPLAINKAGITSHFDALQVTYGSVMAGVGSDERRLPSALDILANAQISGFETVTVNPEQVHETRILNSRSAIRIGDNPVSRPVSR